MTKVSVIIPVYKAEKYISRCAVSLFEQTLQDIEFIFVNDCTPDNSINILKEEITKYPHRRNQIKIINHLDNRGSAAARNTGLTASCGEYIIHCDSDDWVEADMYEEMYARAIEGNFDIVTSDFWSDKANYSKYDKQFFQKDPHEYIRSLLNRKTHGGSWSKLIRKSVFIENNLKFVEGLNMWEDLLMAIKTFYFAKKISHIAKAFYHYDKNNPNSQVENYDTETLNQIVKIANEIECFFKEQNVLKKFENDLNSLKMYIKYLHLKKGDNSMHMKSVTLYSELNDFILSSNIKATRKLKLWLVTKWPGLLYIIKTL